MSYHSEKHDKPITIRRVFKVEKHVFQWAEIIVAYKGIMISFYANNLEKTVCLKLLSCDGGKPAQKDIALMRENAVWIIVKSCPEMASEHWLH